MVNHNELEYFPDRSTPMQKKVEENIFGKELSPEVLEEIPKKRKVLVQKVETLFYIGH